VDIAGARIEGVLDTGCQGSAVSEKFLRRYVEYGAYTVVDVARPRGADNAPLQCEAKIFLPTLLGDLVIRVGYYIVKNLAVDVLIGQDVLMKTTIDQVDRFLDFPTHDVRLPIKYRYLRHLKDQEVIEDPSILYVAFTTSEQADEFETKLNEAEEAMVMGIVSQEDDHEETKNIIKLLDDELEVITAARLESIEAIENRRLHEKQREDIIRQKEKLRVIIQAYPSLFAKSFLAGTLKVPPVNLEFNREAVKPVVSRLRPLAHSELKIVEEWIKESLAKGIIEESNSAWRSTVFPVPKPDALGPNGEIIKKYRVVTPFFGLNKLLNLRATPMPHILDVQGAVAGSTHFSTLDLRESFFQIPLEEGSREFTAFAATGTRLYHYRVMPMGCSISTALLQSALTRILGEDYFTNCISYADDVIIFSKGSEDEHMEIVKKILRKLEDARAKVNLSKVQLCKEEVEFLGMKVSKHGWELSDKYKKAVQDAPRPTCLKSLRSFLGLANWQRRFIHHYSQIARPLTELTKKQQSTVKDSWKQEHEEAFQKLKEELISDKVLAHPDFEKPFYLFSDASDLAIGACLCQKDHKGKMQIIGYTSRKFRPGEVSRGIPEKETMALVEGLENFRPFVLGYKTICYVDQRSVRWLLEKNHPSKFTRYRERLEIYDYEIKHISGTTNVSDWISRYAYMGVISTETGDDTKWENVLLDDPFWRELRGIGETYGPVQQYFKWNRYTFDRKHFTDVDGVCKYQGKVLVPEEGVKALLIRIHNEDSFTSHQGVTRTAYLIEKRYYWPNWRMDVRDFVRSCIRCQKNKKGRLVSVPRRQLDVPDRKFGTISIDVWGYGALDEDRQHKALITVIDRLTNYVQFLPIKSREMEEMMKVLARGWFSKFGFPDAIHADNEYNNAWLEAYCEYFKVSRSFTGFYAPFQNGQVERVHRFLGDQMRMLEEQKANWIDYIDYIAAKYNAGWCSSVNEAPHYLVYGQDFRLATDEDEAALRRIGQLFVDVKRMKLIEENVKKYREEKFAEFVRRHYGHRQEEGYRYCPGDVVWWFSHQSNNRVRKFDGAAGPYRVMKVIASNLVELDRVDGKNRQYVRAASSQLKLCSGDDAEV